MFLHLCIISTVLLWESLTTLANNAQRQKAAWFQLRQIKDLIVEFDMQLIPTWAPAKCLQEFEELWVKQGDAVFCRLVPRPCNLPGRSLTCSLGFFWPDFHANVDFCIVWTLFHPKTSGIDGWMEGWMEGWKTYLNLKKLPLFAFWDSVNLPGDDWWVCRVSINKFIEACGHC